MIDKLYKDYFQKSRAFIFPLVNITKKAAFVPACTYLSWKGIYTPADSRLIATYEVDVTSENWNTFLKDFLCRNPFFEHYAYAKDNKTVVVVFNIQQRKESYDYVIQGKYSKINPDMRSLILCYYGNKTGEYKYMETFLNPSKFVQLYSKLLDADEELLNKVGELCNCPDMTKECLVLETEGY